MAHHGPEDLLELAIHVIVATFLFSVIALAAVSVEVIAHAFKTHLDAFSYTVLISMSRLALSLDAIAFSAHMLRFTYSVCRGE